MEGGARPSFFCILAQLVLKSRPSERSNSLAVIPCFAPHFLVHDIRHLRDVAVVIFFQYIHEPLNAAPRHSFFRISRKEWRGAAFKGSWMYWKKITTATSRRC